MRTERSGKPGKIVLATLFVALVAARLDGAPLSALVPGLGTDVEARLRAGEAVYADAGAVGKLSFLPSVPEAAEIRSLLERMRPDYTVEVAYLVPGAAPPGTLGLFNALTAFATISGVTYHSFNRGGRETVLYSDVFRTDAPGSTRKLPDTAERVVPARGRYDIHIRDVNFGSTWYSMEIVVAGGGISMAMSNTKPISVVLVRVFPRGALESRFLVLPVDEGVLFYGLCAASPDAMAARFVHMYSAAEKRLEAIRKWAAPRIGDAIRAGAISLPGTPQRGTAP